MELSPLKGLQTEINPLWNGRKTLLEIETEKPQGQSRDIHNWLNFIDIYMFIEYSRVESWRRDEAALEPFDELIN